MKILLLLSVLVITGCTSNIDVKRPEFSKSPCACNKVDWEEKHA